MLQQVCLYQVVEDVILADPLHGAAAGRTQGGAFHPAGVAGRTEGVHAGLEADGGGEERGLRGSVQHTREGTNRWTDERSKLSPHTVIQQVLADDTGQ